MSKSFVNISQHSIVLKAAFIIFAFVSTIYSQETPKIQMGLPQEHLNEIAKPPPPRKQYTMNGFIRDSTSKEDIISAKIIVKELKTGGLSNHYGFYSIKMLEGEYTIEVRFSGYTSRIFKLTMQQDVVRNIYLTPLSYKSAEIVVTANKENKNISTTSMGKTELTIDMVQKLPSFLGENDVIRAMLLTPGVTSSSDLAAGFNVRGGGSDQNLILLDDAILYNPSHFGGLFSVFNGDALKSATLYKTNFPVEYGGRLSSVLDVRQKDGNANKYGGVLALGVIASHATIEGPLGSDKGSFIVSARRSYTDLIINAVQKIANPNASPITLFFADVNAKVNYTLSETDRIYGSFYWGNDQMGTAIGNISLGGANTSNVITYGNIAGTFRWNHIYSKDLFSNLILSYSEYNYGTSSKSSTDTKISSTQTNTSTSSVDMFQRMMTVTLKNNYTYSVNNDITFQTGLEGTVNAFIPGKTTTSQTTTIPKASFSSTIGIDNQYTTEWAVYAGLDQDVTDYLKFEYGARFYTFFRLGPQDLRTYPNNQPVTYDPITGIASPTPYSSVTSYGTMSLMAFYFGVEPRATIRYMIDDETSLKGGYSWLSQNIHMLSLSSMALPTDTWYPSGPYIKPQTSHNFSLGVYRNFLNNEIEISVEGYYRILNNILDYVEGANVVMNNYIETAVKQVEGRAYGVEFLLKKNKGYNHNLWDNFTGSISYTFAVSERKLPNEVATSINVSNLWYPSPYDKTHTLHAMVSYEIADWTFSSAFSYQTNIPVNIPIGYYTTNPGNTNGTVSYGTAIYTYYGFSRNQYRLSAYHRLDLSVRYDLKTAITAETFKTDKELPVQISFIFSVYNVYNRINSVGIFMEGESNAVREYGMLPLLPNFTIECKF